MKFLNLHGLLFLLASLASFAPVAFAQATEPPAAISGKALIEELRKGGLIVYFRHTKTLPEHEHEAKMRREGKWRAEDCSTQRNLSEAGLNEANEQREWVVKIGIPFDKVLSSSACRARIHAERVTQKSIEFTDVLTPSRSEEKAIALRKMLNTPPAPRTNTFMFAHGGILWNATDYDSVESETFVFRPAAEGKPPTLLASIKMTDWPALARGEPCCAPRAFWRGVGAPQVD
jgi:phosphohistidine phosphatase SixA